MPRARHTVRRYWLALLIGMVALVGAPIRSASASAPDPGVNHVTLAAGESHFCAIKADGSLWCWGSNDRGQLGLGSTLDQGTPQQVGIATDWVEITGGASTTCGIRSSAGVVGTLWCWGANDSGELGIGSLVEQHLPTQVGTDSQWVSVSLGYNHACGITASKQLFCWGSNGNGQLGSGGDYETSPVQIKNDTQWVSVASGAQTTLAVDDLGHLWAWGDDSYGQLGDATVTNAPLLTPMQIGTETTWQTAVRGRSWSATCARKSDDTLWCAGDNYYGTFGDGTKENGFTTHIRAGGAAAEYSDVSLSGSDYMCGVRSDSATLGTLWCWGSENGGATPGPVGEGGLANPVQLGTDADWSAVATSYGAGCAMRTSGQIYCWGDNYYGQLGRGLNPKTALGDWSQVSAGSTYTCGVRVSDSAGFCWGSNIYSVLGKSASAHQLRGEPVLINDVTVTKWRSIAVGSTFTCGVALATAGVPDASGWCWGYQRGGALGNGDATEIEVHTPTRIGDASCAGTAGCSYDLAWTHLSLSTFSACGIESGNLWCWGEGIGGDLGDGNDGQRDYGAGYLENYRQPLPQHIGSASDWLTVASGIYFNGGGGARAGTNRCGIRAGDIAGAGALWCWGRMFGNVPSQLGSDSDWTSVALGMDHLCAIKVDGTLWCFGGNDSGQLGTGDLYGDLENMRQVGTATDWQAIGAGWGATCGLRGTAPSSHLYCWGDNNNRLQAVFGDPGATRALSPTEITTPFAPTALSMHGSHACVLGGGLVACHGSAGSGELGLFLAPEASGTVWRLPTADPAADSGGGLPSTSRGSGDFSTRLFELAILIAALSFSQRRRERSRT